MDLLVDWLDQTRAGDIASIVGLLIAMIGFAVTIRNVRASKAAALRAEEAANQARSAIRFFDVVAEISTAIAAMEEIRRLHRDAAWPILPDRYNALRKSLVTIRGSDLQLSEEQEARIRPQSSILPSWKPWSRSVWSRIGRRKMLRVGTSSHPVTSWSYTACCLSSGPESE
jgi:hypothetical protein